MRRRGNGAGWHEMVARRVKGKVWPWASRRRSRRVWVHEQLEVDGRRGRCPGRLVGYVWFVCAGWKFVTGSGNIAGSTVSTKAGCNYATRNARERQGSVFPLG